MKIKNKIIFISIVIISMSIMLLILSKYSITKLYSIDSYITKNEYTKLYYFLDKKFFYDAEYVKKQANDNKLLKKMYKGGDDRSILSKKYIALLETHESTFEQDINSQVNSVYMCPLKKNLNETPCSLPTAEIGNKKNDSEENHPTVEQIDDILQETEIEQTNDTLSKASPATNPKFATQKQQVVSILPSKHISLLKKIIKPSQHSSKNRPSSVAKAIIGIPGLPLYAVNLYGQRGDAPSGGDKKPSGTEGNNSSSDDEEKEEKNHSHYDSEINEQDKHTDKGEKSDLVGAVGGTSDNFTNLDGNKSDGSNGFEVLDLPSHNHSEPWQKLIVVDDESSHESHTENSTQKNESDNNAEPKPLKDLYELGEHYPPMFNQPKQDMSMGIIGPGDDLIRPLINFCEPQFQHYKYIHHHHHSHHQHRYHHQQQQHHHPLHHHYKIGIPLLSPNKNKPGPLMNELPGRHLQTKNPSIDNGGNNNEQQKFDPYKRPSNNSIEDSKKENSHHSNSSKQSSLGLSWEKDFGQSSNRGKNKHLEEQNDGEHSNSSNVSIAPLMSHSSSTGQQNTSVENNQHSNGEQNPPSVGCEHRGPMSTSNHSSSCFVQLNKSGSDFNNESNQPSGPKKEIVQSINSSPESEHTPSNNSSNSSFEKYLHLCYSSVGNEASHSSGESSKNNGNTQEEHTLMPHNNSPPVSQSFYPKNDNESENEASSEYSSSEFSFEKERNFDHFSSENGNSLDGFEVVEHGPGNSAEVSPFKPTVQTGFKGTPSPTRTGLLLPPSSSDDSKSLEGSLKSGGDSNNDESSDWSSSNSFDLTSENKKIFLVQTGGHPHRPPKKNDTKQPHSEPSENPNGEDGGIQQNEPSYGENVLCFTKSSGSNHSHPSHRDHYNEHEQNPPDETEDHSAHHQSQSSLNDKSKSSSKSRSSSIGSNSGSSIILLNGSSSGDSLLEYPGPEDDEGDCLGRECKRKRNSDSNSESDYSCSFERLGNSSASWILRNHGGSHSSTKSNSSSSSSIIILEESSSEHYNNNRDSSYTDSNQGNNFNSYEEDTGHQSEDGGNKSSSSSSIQILSTSNDSIDWPNSRNNSESEYDGVNDGIAWPGSANNSGDEHNSDDGIDWPNPRNNSEPEHDDSDDGIAWPGSANNSEDEHNSDDEIDWPNPRNNSESEHDGSDDGIAWPGSANNSENGDDGSKSDSDSHPEGESNNNDTDGGNRSGNDELSDGYSNSSGSNGENSSLQYRRPVMLGAMPPARATPRRGNPSGANVRQVLSKTPKNLQATQAKRPPISSLDSYRNACKALTQAIHAIAQSSQQAMRSLALATTTGYPDTTKRFRIFGSASTKKPYPKKHQPYAVTVGVIANPFSAINLGVAYTYTQHTTKDFHISNTDALFEGSAAGKLQTNHISLITAWNPEGYGLTGFLEYAYGTGDATLIRKFAYDNLAFTAKGKTRTHTDGGTARIGYRFKVTETIAVTPYGELAAVRARWNNYSENKGKFPANISSTKELVREERLGIETRWQIVDNCQIYAWGAYISSKKKNGVGIEALLTIDDHTENMTVSKYSRKQSMGEIGAAIAIKPTEHFGISFNTSIRTKSNSKVGLDSQYIGTSIWYAF
ncbi:autotransporter domain-containing protein (plasmid) [Lawsonia intracellularis]|nr:autotransporter domain-containing protein [Lawsonia intracellularis]